MKMTQQAIVVCVTGLLAVCVSGPARADWGPDDPYKMHYPQLPDPNGWDVSVMTPNTIADDFLCTQSGLITDVHIWASAESDYGYPYPDLGDGLAGITNGALEPPDVDVQVHLSIHSDIPDSDGTGPLYSMPGDLLWQWDTLDAAIVPVPIPGLQGWYDPYESYWQAENHQFYFQVNIDIPEGIAFEQQEGTIYWLDVQVLVTAIDPLNQFPLPQFGWKTSLDHWNDDAVYIDAQGVWQELLDPATGESLDMAFAIAPEPITLAVLVLGMVPAALRKRQRSL